MIREIICKTSDLKTALAFTGKVINRNTVLPVLECHLFEAHGKLLKITTGDLETFATKAINMEKSMDTKFSFCMYASSAGSFIQAMTGETVTLVIEEHLSATKEKSVAITIKSGNKVGKFMGEDAMNYPKIPSVDGTPYVVSDELQDAVTRSLKYVSNDDLRPAMTGVYFGKDAIVATDAHRLFEHKHSLAFEIDFICSAKASGLVPKLKDCKLKIESKQADGSNIDSAATWAAFYNKSTMIVTRAIDARYPDYKVVMPTDNHIKWKCNKAELKEILRTIAIAANRSTSQVQLSMKEKVTTINAQDVDFSMEANGTLAATCTHAPFSIAFNSNFLLTMISDSKTDDVELLLAMSTKAAIMVQENETYLLMPLMLNGGGDEEPKGTGTRAEAVKEATGDNDNDLREDEEAIIPDDELVEEMDDKL